MNEKLFDTLETCLQAIERGETVDSVLARFPSLAVELRPILEASLHARGVAGAPISDVVQRRGRAKLLQHAAELREAKRAPRRTWLYTLRPLAVTLILLVFLLSGTGLVRASSTSLPGDGLYPVKRTWEDFRLIFVHDDAARESLEVGYENERVEEVSELLAVGRAEEVTFTGYVTAQADGLWTVAGVPVYVSNETTVPQKPIAVGAAVTVTGRTDAQGYLMAQSIATAVPGAIISTADDSNETEGDSSQDTNGNESDGENANGSESGSGGGGDAQKSNGNKIEGKIESINGNVWIVNGKSVNVSGAEIVGSPAPGAQVVIEGYYDTDGVFIATRVVFSNDSIENGGSTDKNENEKEGSDSKDDKDDSSDNEDSHESNAPMPTRFAWHAVLR